jgi:hypothetical protein
MVTLNQAEYFKVLENAAASGLTGGSIYDAVVASCALKAKARTIYTWNVRQFSRRGTQVAARVRVP